MFTNWILELSLFVSLICTVLTQAVDNSLFLSKQRDLGSCNSYTDCDSCNSNEECNYVTSECQQYNQYSIFNTEFNQSSEYQYCAGLDQDEEYIYMSQVGYSVDLFARQNMSPMAHSMCEWRILFKTDYDIHIDITRSTSQLEEMYMYTNTNGDNNYFYSKDLASCSEETYRITLSNTGYIRLRVNKLSDLSNYSITVSQPYHSPYDYSVVIFVACGASICCSLTTLAIIIYCCIKNIRAQDNRVVLLPDQLSKLEHISKCLNNMTQGLFSELVMKFSEDSCVVCLEEFANDSKVCIINECEHVFHAKCLDTWFRNIRCDKDLTCPHCNTTITETSSRKVEKTSIKPSDNSTDRNVNWHGMNGTTHNMVIRQILQSIESYSPRSHHSDDAEAEP